MIWEEKELEKFGNGESEGGESGERGEIGERFLKFLFCPKTYIHLPIEPKVPKVQLIQIKAQIFQYSISIPTLGKS